MADKGMASVVAFFPSLSTSAFALPFPQFPKNNI